MIIKVNYNGLSINADMTDYKKKEDVKRECKSRTFGRKTKVV